MSTFHSKYNILDYDLHTFSTDSLVFLNFHKTIFNYNKMLYTRKHHKLNMAPKMLIESTWYSMANQKDKFNM